MPLVAVMLEGIIMGFLYRKATTGPFCPAGSMDRAQRNGVYGMQEYMTYCAHTLKILNSAGVGWVGLQTQVVAHCDCHESCQ